MRIRKRKKKVGKLKLELNQNNKAWIKKNNLTYCKFFINLFYLYVNKKLSPA